MRTQSLYVTLRHRRTSSTERRQGRSDALERRARLRRRGLDAEALTNHPVKVRGLRAVRCFCQNLPSFGALQRRPACARKGPNERLAWKRGSRNAAFGGRVEAGRGVHVVGRCETLAEAFLNTRDQRTADELEEGISGVVRKDGLHEEHHSSALVQCRCRHSSELVAQLSDAREWASRRTFPSFCASGLLYAAHRLSCSRTPIEAAPPCTAESIVVEYSALISNHRRQSREVAALFAGPKPAKPVLIKMVTRRRRSASEESDTLCSERCFLLLSAGPAFLNINPCAAEL